MTALDAVRYRKLVLTVYHVYMNGHAGNRPPMLTEASLLAIYGECMVRFGQTDIALGKAVELEEMMCPVSPEDRNKDIAGRLAYLAGKLYQSRALIPEHYPLLEPLRQQSA